MENTIKPISPLSIIRANELVKDLDIHPSTLHNWTNPKSKYYKDDFPKKIKLGGRARGWYRAQIKQWLDDNQINYQPSH